MTHDREPGRKHAGTPKPEDSATGLLAWLIRASMLGSLLAVVGAIFEWVPVLAAGFLLLILGCTAVGVLVFKDSRRVGRSPMRSLRRGFGAAFGWLYDYH